jgi:hypothetical protein
MQTPVELQCAVLHIVPLVSKFRQAVLQAHTHKSGLELEVRLGRRHESGRWETDVGASTFFATLELLQSYTHWASWEDARDSHDYFYALPSGARVRTSVGFDQEVKVTHVQKQALGALDVKLVTHCFDARVSLKSEVPVDAKALPHMVEPTLVRIKKRWSFWLDKWRFDLTQVWSGVTRAVAESNQARNYCTFEVEVECVCDAATVGSLSDEYIALSMLLKLCSLLGGTIVRMLPMHASDN